MSREEKVALVEAFLDCLTSKQLDRLPIAPDLTIESPMIPKVSGHAAMEYLKFVAGSVKSIEVKQHIVEGEHVATFLEEETINGPLEVFSKFQIESGRIKDVRVFYDPRRIARST